MWPLKLVVRLYRIPLTPWFLAPTKEASRLNLTLEFHHPSWHLSFLVCLLFHSAFMVFFQERRENEKKSTERVVPALSVSLKLPDHILSDLLKLVRLGHVKGLVAALEKIAEAEPKFSGLCAQFREMVMRFELEQVEFVLQEQLGMR